VPGRNNGASETNTTSDERGVDPAIEARQLSAGYGPIAVIRDVDLAVHAGELVALLGANGAGKSTMLLTLAGALTPSRGEIRFLGSAAKGGIHRRARAGMRFVADDRSIFPSLSTSDNLRLGGGSFDAALELFPELKPLLKRRAGLLSGGEQQILTLARALSGEPKVLLADELSLGLAPMIVDRLLDALTAATGRGVAVLLVEQQVRHALACADRGYVMRRGQIAITGPASDLLKRIDEIEATYLEGAEVAHGQV
jgi:branched-chain amino acid transport system ATP-binding protein